MKVWILRSLRRRGLYVGRYRDPMVQLASIIKSAEFQTVLDVGANKGDYSDFVRKSGYLNHIVAFEPVQALYLEVCKRFSSDSLWLGHKLALSRESGQELIHIASNNGASSSLLRMENRHKTAAPSVLVDSSELVTTSSLLQFIDEALLPNPMFLKLDTQGTELDILLGADNLLGTSILGVQVELSTIPLYKNGCKMSEVINLLESKGFRAVWSCSGFTDAGTGELLQLDMLFLHESLALRDLDLLADC